MSARGWIALCALGAAAVPTMVHTAPPTAPAGRTFLVEGTMGHVDGVDRVVLRFRQPAEDFRETPMEAPYGDLYRARIPASVMVPPGIEYYVEVVDKAGHRTEVCYSRERPARVFIFPADAGASAERAEADGGP